MTTIEVKPASSWDEELRTVVASAISEIRSNCEIIGVPYAEQQQLISNLYDKLSAASDACVAEINGTRAQKESDIDTLKLKIEELRKALELQTQEVCASIASKT